MTTEPTQDLLNEQQWRTLGAVVERIVPRDDYPSGWDAGVGDYLERQLETDLRPYRDVYQLWLDALEAEANTRYGTSFAGLGAAEADDLLALIDDGNVATVWQVDPVAGFVAIVGHVMEGYYGDPGNGGNRDGLAWQMIGFEVRG
jgi:hypothetical protein